MNIDEITSVLEDVNSLINGNFFSGNEEIEIEIFEMPIIVKNDKQFLKNLGKYKKIKECDQKIKCPICLEKFKVGKFKRILPICLHQFHKKCIDKWIINDENKECPICRCNYKCFNNATSS